LKYSKNNAIGNYGLQIAQSFSSKVTKGKYMKNSLVLMIAVSLSLIATSSEAQTKGDYPQGPTKGQVGQGGRDGGYRPQSQPNPYPPGTKGNPGGYRPEPQSRSYPQYPQNRPSYPSYPQNYPNYRFPVYPSANIAPCVILANYDSYGTVYQVINAYGNVTETAYSYAQALAAADVQERQRNCYGVVFQSNNDYPQQGSQYPNTYPSNYPNSQNFCQVMDGRDAYGNYLYRVLDRAGRVLSTTSDYSQAQYVSRSDARCFQSN
jgi:hypothetical protein